MRLKCCVAYDGSKFSGWQKQTNARSVQAEIECVLTLIHKHEVPIYGSGRTDAGVHALAQVFHFDTDLNMPIDAWLRALRALLPEDIDIYDVQEVKDDFHARFSASGKRYRYYLHTKRNIFKNNYSYCYEKNIDVAVLNELCQLFVGTHNFVAFNSTPKEDIDDQVRTVTYFEVHKTDDGLYFEIRGTGFLRYMVRMLVATTLAYQENRISKDEVIKALDAGNKQSISFNVPSHGLYLMEVYYDENY